MNKNTNVKTSAFLQISGIYFVLQIVFAIALSFWKFCAKRYESTGT